jgi:hypothetical protein
MIPAPEQGAGMRTIEIARIGDSSVADQMAEMHEWLREAGIHPLQLEPMRILRARVLFRATFANDDDAERFRRRFDEEGAGKPA